MDEFTMNYIKENKTELINDLIQAIKNFNNNPGALENLENYLNRHFITWSCTYASNAPDLISELYHFSTIE